METKYYEKEAWKSMSSFKPLGDDDFQLVKAVGDSNPGPPVQRFLTLTIQPVCVYLNGDGEKMKEEEEKENKGGRKKGGR